MSRSLAIIASVGLIFIAGCEKKPIDKVPLVAPGPATTAADVLVHLQYAMVRNDPKHLEAFAPEDKDKFLGAVSWFHYRAGMLGIKLTQEEVNALGIQDFVDKGYISLKYSRREFNAALKQLDSGKQLPDDVEKSLGTINQARLDMPRENIPDKKLAEKLRNDLTDAIDANPKAIYAAGLYRILKAIPASGWPYVEAIVANHAGGDKKLNDLRLMVDETPLTPVTVGRNPNGNMFVWFVDFDRYPESIAKLFPEPAEGGK